METKNKNGAAVQNGTAKEDIKGTTTTVPANANGQHPKVNEANHKPATPVAEVQTLPPAPAAAQEPIPAVKPALNLEGTLKVVEDLHRRSIQRINLISRIKQLEGFEVALAQEHDELDENPYQGCKLIIEDDKRRQFVTTTPGLIRLVSQFIFNACQAKLGDIEANIVFPKV